MMARVCSTSESMTGEDKSLSIIILSSCRGRAEPSELVAVYPAGTVESECPVVPSSPRVVADESLLPCSVGETALTHQFEDDSISRYE